MEVTDEGRSRSRGGYPSKSGPPTVLLAVPAGPAPGASRRPQSEHLWLRDSGGDFYHATECWCWALRTDPNDGRRIVSADASPAEALAAEVRAVNDLAAQILLPPDDARSQP